MSDEIAFNWVLKYLGIQPNTRPAPNWIPAASDLQLAFASLRGMNDESLIRVGRMAYVDGGPPGRVAPTKHVEEDFDEVVRRVEAAVQSASVTTDWAFSCWVVNTEQGSAVIRRTLERKDST